MKKNLSVLVLAFVLLGMQACGPKSTEKNEASAPVTPVALKSAEPTKAEKKAKLEKERADRAEKRRAEREKIANASLTYKDAMGHIVYNKAETDPSFVGGDDAMTAYLNKNLKFPQEGLDKGIEGTVFVDFVVGKDGRVREAEVTDEINYDNSQSFRDEAMRVVSSMPKWSPGRQHNKAVDVKFSIPITFELK